MADNTKQNKTKNKFKMPSDTGKKVGRVCQKYGLYNLHDSLAAMYDEGNGKSLRELEDLINMRILQTAISEQVSGGEYNTTPTRDFSFHDMRDILRGKNDTDAADRIELESQLEQIDLNPDELRNDFVSHTIVRQYLREVLDEHHETQAPSAEDDVQVIRTAAKQLENRAERKLRLAAERGEIEMRGCSVEVSVDVLFDDSHEIHTFSEARRECSPDSK